MKKLLLSCLLLAFALGSQGQQRDSENIFQRLIWDDQMLNILVDMRFDGQYRTGNTDGREYGFRTQALKIWLTGEIVPGIRYRVRQRLNKVTDPLRDNLSGGTDHAWVAFDIGKAKRWTITAGKQSVQFGTFEYDYNTADVYLSTMCNSDLDGYKAGVNVAYRFARQTMNLQVFNSDADQFASHEFRNKALGGSILWEGDLFDSVLRTRWAYSLFQHNKTRFYNWLTAGIQLNIDAFTTELDYFFGVRNMNYSSVAGPDKLSFVRDQSVSAHFKYTIEKWHPFVKGTWNQRHDKDLRQNAYMSYGIQGGVEFYPFARKELKDLRFHFAYSYTNTGYRGPWDSMADRDGHLVLAGMRWMFKVK